jgi:hypothetical protein
LIVRTTSYNKERPHERRQVYWDGCTSGNDLGGGFEFLRQARDKKESPLGHLTRIGNSQHCTSLPSREVSRPLSASRQSQKLRVNQSLSVGYLDFPCHSPGRGWAGTTKPLTRGKMLSIHVLRPDGSVVIWRCARPPDLSLESKSDNPRAQYEPNELSDSLLAPALQLPLSKSKFRLEVV